MKNEPVTSRTRAALEPKGRTSPGFERMWHILQSIDECLDKDADACLEPVKDLELLQVENRFLWSTGTLFDWKDPGMADVVVQWVKTLIRRDAMSKEEGRLLVDHCQKKLKPQLGHLKKLASRQGKTFQTLDALDPEAVQVREPQPGNHAAHKPQAASKPAQSTPAKPKQDQHKSAPAKPAHRPKPAAAQQTPTAAEPAMDFSPLLEKIEQDAREEVREYGRRVTLPNSVFSLLAQPDLPPDAEGWLSGIFLDPEGMELDQLVSNQGEKPPHTQFLQALAQRCKQGRHLSGRTQQALWKLRNHAASMKIGNVQEYAERLIFCQDEHPEGLTQDIVDSTLAEDQLENLKNLLKRHRAPLPEKTLTRIAVLTTDLEVLHSLARRDDLTQSVIERLLRKPLWRANPGAKAGLMAELKSNPVSRKLMSNAMQGLKSKQEAAA